MYPDGASLVVGLLFALEDHHVLVSGVEDSSSDLPKAPSHLLASHGHRYQF